MKHRWLLLLLPLWAAPLGAAEPSPVVKIGSKKFTESVILAQMAYYLVRDVGGQAVHRRELGTTPILWAALLKGDIDLYPEYTGTLLKDRFPGRTDLKAALAEKGMCMSRSLGFSNSYALGMRADVARRLGIRTISDLRNHPDLRYGFSEEFKERPGDGWRPLKRSYGLNVPDAQVRTLDHDLATRGLKNGNIDVSELYTTEGEIRTYGLVVLEDDRHFFPAYDAVWVYRADLRSRLLPRLPPQYFRLSGLFSAAGGPLQAASSFTLSEEQLTPVVLASLFRLEGKISDAEMIEMNAQALAHRVSENHIAAGFLREKLGLSVQVEEESLFRYLLRLTGEHLLMVVVSLAAAVIVAIPLGVVAARRPLAGQAILGVVSVLQTVPSLALLVFLIPLLGLGWQPAVAALFIYSLLPVVRNTYTGLHDIPGPLRESARALGLPPAAILRLVEMPLASRSILAGIKTAAVINVGTATLGALIGAGGYGQPILTGIRLDSAPLILEGAIPAALLALLVQGFFELAERWLSPRGLRLRPE
jgi:osmoprotectant transport system permease protein